ncbi:sulfurtransferase complex subunit TusC [Thalassotalea sp. PS06]|uniref:sulfurtransferase complex subunit TusC n=1 Tax=Thalassotalea sp. PS06 TaxID=2594005 RepID=UPI001162F011|nr:sulfurtransferase complex subunit TusC [Thalassotalea sp. PS06]QDP01358.1 sulfurtransferase complex subunit TusC [Thalassotalea sp. PS06]
MINNNRIAIVNTATTFDDFKAKEALDLALIFASYEMPVALFFMADGVFQTTANQNPELIGNKDFIATFKALGFYDIDDIFICQQDMQQRQISGDLAVNDPQILPRNDFNRALNEYDLILTF